MGNGKKKVKTGTIIVEVPKPVIVPTKDAMRVRMPTNNNSTIPL